jgi:hypothetical protein
MNAALPNGPTDSTRRAPSAHAFRDDAERLQALLAFEAPYVAERLVTNKSARTVEEGHELFEEAKKYLWLIATDRERDYPIVSLRVDEAWHQFLLYTRECEEFCYRFFGTFMNHAPPTKQAPDPAAKPRPVVTRELFAERYREVFGKDLPRVWRDDLAVDRDQRVVANEGPFEVRGHGEKIELVEASGSTERVRLRVDAWAEPALRFALEKGIFYVRELPGLDDDERIDLCRVMVAEGILIVVA